MKKPIPADTESTESTESTVGEAAQDPSPAMPAAIQTEDLIGSKKFARYHPDILRALLPKGSYTLDEAEKIVAGYFNRQEGGEA